MRPMAFEDALATWLVKQRWFAGKGRSLRDLAIIADTEVVGGDPELRHLIITVSHGTTVDYYQVLAGLRRRLPARLAHARIGPAGDGRQAYDALHDADLTKPLLAALAAEGSVGSLQMHKVPGARFRTGLTASCSVASRATPAWSSARSRSSRCSAGSPPGRTPILR